MTIEVTGGSVTGTGPGAAGLEGTGAELLDGVADAMEDAMTAADLRRFIDELRAGRIDPESVIQMCRSRLNDLDAQINHVTTSLEDASVRSEALSGEISELRMIQRYLSPYTTGSAIAGLPANVVLTRDGLEAQLQGIGLSVGRVNEILTRVSAQGGFDGTWIMNPLTVSTLVGFEIRTPADITSKLESLNTDLRHANSGNERLMISLQSLMQQRTSAIQMATNMLKAIDDGVDAIVGNLR